MKKYCILLVFLLMVISCTSKKEVINKESIDDNSAQVTVNTEEIEKQVEEKKDDFIPIISIVNDVIYIGDENFDPNDNVAVEFGESGGQVVFSDIKEGDNNVVCKAVGNNGLVSEATFRVIKSVTYNKNVIFFGDSIVYGYLTKGYSFTDYLNNNYDFNNCVNSGKSDYRLSTYDDPNKWLVTLIKNHKNDSINYDYVILQGGVNDVIYNTPIGQISSDKNIDSFDVNTFVGGLETYLYETTNAWPNARIGYIITYYPCGYSERGLQWSYDDYKKYNDILKQVLDKWDIPYIDLFNQDFSDLLKVETSTYLPDHLHPNKNGYDLLTPYIYDWMKCLKKYSK